MHSPATLQLDLSDALCASVSPEDAQVALTPPSAVADAPGPSEGQDGPICVRRGGHHCCPKCGAPVRDGLECGLHRNPVKRPKEEKPQ